MTLISENMADSHAAPGRSKDWRRARVPRISIHVLIVLLMFALIAPAGLFLGHIVQRIEAQREQDVSRRGEQLADEVADRLEGEFRTLGTLLSVFSSSGWLEEEHYRRLHQRAQRALSGTGRHLLVLDETLDQLLNTRVPYGTRLGKTSNPGAAKAVLEQGGLAVSDQFLGQVAQQPVFNVLQRAVLPDGRRLVLILTRNATDLRQLFGSAMDANGWSFAVLDGTGQVVVKEIDAEQSDPHLPGICLEPGFGFRTWSAAAGQQYVFQRTVGTTRWNVCVWGGSERLLARAGGLWGVFLTATVAWFALAIAAAIALSTSVSRAIADTARISDALEAGRPVTVAPSFITEVDNVRRALAGAAEERLRKDRERQLLLRETAHRAKNQMTLAVSLVGLSAQSARDVDALRNDVTERLVALGRSVDAVAGQQANAAPLDRLTRLQLEPFLGEDGERLVLRGESLLVSQTAAQSLSLILHELATNAAKYGGWSVEGGSVEVSWRVEDEQLALDWIEHGGRGGGTPERTGFGTTLVDGLVRGSFRGTVTREFRPQGFRCRIVMPLEAVTVRTGGNGD